MLALEFRSDKKINTHALQNLNGFAQNRQDIGERKLKQYEPVN